MKRIPHFLHFLFFFLVLFFIYKMQGDPLYLNNANPFPLFSSQGRYDRMSRESRDKIKEFILGGSEIECIQKENIFHANFMPYIQYATTGTNYLGESSLRTYINNNLIPMPINDVDTIQENIPEGSSQQAAPSPNTLANLIKTVPMPFSAIPEPFNYFALFYTNNPHDPYEPQVYKTGELITMEYDLANDPESKKPEEFIEAQRNFPVPFDSSYYNQVPKIVARYLGMSDAPFIIAEKSSGEQDPSSARELGVAIPSPLMYDYSNYANHFFGLMQYPPSRDPKKLFGYGYFNAKYQKVGVRGTFEWSMNGEYGLKIYTGYSNLDISQITVEDTTINYQGPTAAMMFSRYPDPIYTVADNKSPDEVDPYIQPNIYQLTNYTVPIIDSSSSALFSSNFYNYSELKNYLPDQFKTSFLQNIQYNIDSLGALINQDFRPYAVQSVDDTTFELFYRRLFVYNKKKEPYKNKETLSHTPYTLLPTAAVHVTCPIAPRVPANKIFGRPLDNNGHWELGGNLGIEFDFISNIVLGSDIGFSWYNDSQYTNYPIPTNQFNQGIYLYSANITRIPGYSYTAAVGMQVDELYSCFDMFLEWRMVRHNEDDFIINSINNLLPIKYMQDTHTSPDEDGALSTIPNGVLYLNFDQKPPYPSTGVISHMRQVSSWLVNMLNFTCNFKINSDMHIGFAWQQPFWLRNAYDAATIGVSFEMYI